MTGAGEIVDHFRVYRCDPELVMSVPALQSGQPSLTIAVAALGGGTPGRAYAGNGWVYAVHLDGDLVVSGADLYSGGFARTIIRWSPRWPSISPTPPSCRSWLGRPIGCRCGPTTWRPAVTMAEREIVTDDRCPGWRARIVVDDLAGQPSGDALAPALVVESRHAEWATALGRISERDLTVITFDTAAYRDHVGITGTADLTGEILQWRAWLDGDVYEVVVEQHTAEQCWTYQDALCGLYGWLYAQQRAVELLADNACPPVPAACTA